mmetsp:Transcript_6093/g.19411  ORF Transcript_6093/g.19411 Transcript_6093/m.19411 type:complete len:303 (+) Transcript_6093:3-911(+)
MSSSSSSSSSRLWIIAGVAAAGVVTAGVAYMLFKGSSKAPSKSKEERIKRRKTKREQRAKGSSLEREKLLAVMGDMVSNAKQVMERVRAIQATLQQRIAQGARVDPDEANRQLAAMLQEGLTNANNAACAKHEVNPDEVQQAIKENSEDPEVQRKVKELREALSGDDDEEDTSGVEVPESLTRDRVLEMLDETLREHAKALQEIKTELCEKSGISEDEFKTKIESDISFATSFSKMQGQRVAAIEEAVQKKYEITKPAVARAAIRKYDSDPAFIERMKEIQKEQQRRLKEILGITMPGGDDE